MTLTRIEPGRRMQLIACLAISLGVALAAPVHAKTAADAAAKFKCTAYYKTSLGNIRTFSDKDSKTICQCIVAAETFKAKAIMAGFMMSSDPTLDDNQASPAARAECAKIHAAGERRAGQIIVTNPPLSTALKEFPAEGTLAFVDPMNGKKPIVASLAGAVDLFEKIALREEMMKQSGAK
jgi:hypothetical protein